MARRACGCNGTNDQCPTCSGAGFYESASAKATPRAQAIPTRRGVQKLKEEPTRKVCPICRVQVVNEAQHRREAHSRVCPKCSATTTDLEGHMRQRHLELRPVKVLQKSPRSKQGARGARRCPRCGEMVKHMNRHITKSHSGTERCRLCGAVTEDLQAHLKMAHQGSPADQGRGFGLGMRRPRIG
jgi:hypothetical protein